MMEVTKSQGRMVHKCADNLQKRKKFDRGYVCAGYLFTKRKKKKLDVTKLKIFADDK